MRLYKYVMMYNNMTKAECIALFNKNLILVNDVVMSPSYVVKDKDKITLSKSLITPLKNRYFLYYKPKGILSTLGNTNENLNNNLNLDFKVIPAGRLDKDSEGLLILSNDPLFIDSIMNSIDLIDKTYILTLKDVITTDFINKLSNLKYLDGVSLKPFKFQKLDNLHLSLTICEGKYHQCRKMALLCGNKVVELKRIKIGKYNLSGMKPGDLIEISPR